jgi:hypoxanthine phosphoribosyltransferase
VDIEDARLLIADDVADTGHTLAYVRNFCRGKFAEVRAAVLYQKPSSTIDCEYVWRRTDRGIDVPGSSEPPVVTPRIPKLGCRTEQRWIMAPTAPGLRDAGA